MLDPLHHALIVACVFLGTCWLRERKAHDRTKFEFRIFRR
jgi:hypothetical protein